VPREKPSGSFQSPFGPRRALYDFGYAVRRALVAGGWLDAATAAGIGMLALLCVGAVFLIAAKLQYPGLGAGSNPLSVFTSIVLLALGSLRVPIHIGDLTVTALPLGGLVVSAIAVSWAMEPAIRRREVEGLRARVAAGAKIALPFALLCWLVALLFRFRGGPVPTYAGAAGAFLWGAMWGVVFGALAGLRSAGRLSTHVRSLAAALKRRSAIAYEGLATGAVMLGVSVLLAGAAGLIWVIAALARGAPVAHFGIGDAVAGAIYIVGFLPNILVAIITISLGAVLDVGAQITIGGRQVGPLRTFSLWHWGAGGSPWFAYGLLLIPVIATAAAGFALHRRTKEPRHYLKVLGVAALVYAGTLALIAWLGQARLGAGLVRAHGWGQISPNAALVLVFGLAWAMAGGLAGWVLAERAANKQSLPRRATAERE
jgi:hypothetical protein